MITDSYWLVECCISVNLKYLMNPGHEGGQEYSLRTR